MRCIVMYKHNYNFIEMYKRYYIRFIQSINVYNKVYTGFYEFIKFISVAITFINMHYNFIKCIKIEIKSFIRGSTFGDPQKTQKSRFFKKPQNPGGSRNLQICAPGFSENLKIGRFSLKTPQFRGG